MLLASDGIWDVMTNEQVVRLCLRKIEMGIPPETICEELMTECLSPDLLMTGTDNMTVVLICFLHNKPYADLSKRAKAINERDQKKTDEPRFDSYLTTSASLTAALVECARTLDDGGDEKNGGPSKIEAIAAELIEIDAVSDGDENLDTAANGQPDASKESRNGVEQSNRGAIIPGGGGGGKSAINDANGDDDEEGIVQERKKYKESDIAECA